MLSTYHLLSRHLFAFFAGFASSIILSVNIPSAFFSSMLLQSIIVFPTAYYISNKGILRFQEGKRARELNLTRSEYLEIENQLQLGTKMTQELTQKYVQVRSVKSFKVIYEMSKLSKRILTIIKNDPTKFYLVEDFFYAHLPSALELSDKYALLSKQQVTGTEIHLALEDTRSTLKELYVTMEQDLKQALATDIESLKIELDFAKLANKQRKEQLKIGGEE